MALTQIKTAAIADDAVTLAKQAAGTDGQIITYDASGNPVAVGPGTDGQVLTSTGAGSPPAFEAIPAKTALTGSTNNQITTVTGANAIQGEANLTFDGTTLAATGAMSLSGTADPVTITVQNTDSNTATDSGGDIVFKGSKTNGDPLYFGGIGGRRRNQGSDETGYLALYNQNGDGSNAASEALRIDHTGKVLIGTTTAPTNTGADNLVIGDSGNAGITLRSGSDDNGLIYFSDGTSGAPEYAGFIQYSHGSDNKMYFGAGSATRFQVESNGNVKVNDGDLVIGTSGHGIDFSVNSHESSMSSELFDGYEEGTFTPTIWKGTTQSSLTDSWGKYIKIGGIVHFSFYCFRNWDSSGLSNGSEIWQVGFPFTVIGANGGAWSFIPAGYCRVNSAGPTNDQQIRWQSNSNSGTKLTLYSSNNTANWTSGYIEFSGSGTVYLS